MSLYIGNLSARTRRDELERVFRRFGQCEVRLKDGYGFVVYGFAPQAEKALKVLQGRNICGQQLNMMWSNKQPIPVPRNLRGKRATEPCGRDFSRRKILSDYLDRRGEDLRPNSEGVGEEAMNFIGDEFSRDVDDDHVPEIVDNGRWGERVDKGDVDTDTIDRYEPYHGYDRQHEESSPDNIRRERDRFRKNCFNCGELGHKARDCPEKHSSRKRFERFERSRLRNGGASNSGSRRRTKKDRNSVEIDRKGKRSETETRKKSDSISSHSEYLASRSHSPSKSSRSRARSRSSSRSSSPTSLSLSSSPQLNRKPLFVHGSNRESEDIQIVQQPDSKENNAGSKNFVVGTDVDARTSQIPEADDQTAKPGCVASLSSINHGGPTSVSVEEMRVAMKHFGVELPKESEKFGSLEGLFGSARLWPWEGIYYRRVKKGPISVENYVRRVEQNREFRIVDKYVRSSSGWGQ